MMTRIQANVISKLFRVQVEREDDKVPNYEHKKRRMTMGRGAMPSHDGAEDAPPEKDIPLVHC